MLAVGGLDPSGQAGVLRDFTTLQDCDTRPACVAACLTAQGPGGVRGVFPVEPEVLRAQIEAVLADLQPAVVKVGLVPTAALAATLREVLGQWRPQGQGHTPGQGQAPGRGHTPGRGQAPEAEPLVVVDPVIRATGGTLLLCDDPALWRQEILRLADVLCPNAPELAFLAGVELRDVAEAGQAAGDLLRSPEGGGLTALVVKGGHLGGRTCSDSVVVRGRPPLILEIARCPGPELRGTGCRHASALAAALARGDDVATAARRAQAYVASQIGLPPP